MTFLGITWVLSDEVFNAPEEAWQTSFRQLLQAAEVAGIGLTGGGSASANGGAGGGSGGGKQASRRRGRKPAAVAGGAAAAEQPRLVLPEELTEWLRHQHGLAALGVLPRHRVAALASAGAAAALPPRTRADAKWDARLSELLAWKATHGSCEVPAAAEQAGQASSGLGAWLAEARAEAAAGRLPPGRVAQLRAIGALEGPAPSVCAPAPAQAAIRENPRAHPDEK